MDTETKEKLTELKHQHDMLGNDVEADMKTMKADNEATLAKNESAIDRLRVDIEKALGEFRTTTERRSRVLLLEVACVVGFVVAVMSFIFD